MKKHILFKQNILKSALAVISIAISAVILCSCSFVADSIIGKKVKNTSQSATQSTTEVKSKQDVKTSYSYDNLSSDKLKELYVKIDEHARIAAVGYFNIDAPLNELQLEEAVEAYKNDHPEVFWLKSNFQYINNDDSTSLLLSYSVQPDNKDPERLKKAKEKFDKTVDTIIDNAPKNASDYELELYVNDYLVDNCIYDRNAADKKEICGHENDAYGALVEGKAVCEGYARAFQLLCNNLGIDCITVSGFANEAHAWNNIKLDNEWYEVDVTWNDNDDKDIDFHTYHYLNLPNEKFSKTHITSPLFSETTLEEHNNSKKSLNTFAPKCKGTKYFYYSYSCVTIYDVNDSESITNEIAQAGKDSQEYLDFLIDDSLDFDSTADQIINDGYLSQWIASANLKNWYNPNLDEETIVYLEKKYNVITIVLKYL